MNNNYSILVFIIVLGTLFSLSSCRTAGLYTSNPKNSAAFAGTEVKLTASDSFFISSWTDSFTNYVDSDGNRIYKDDEKYRGFGTYECLDDSLALTFCNEDSLGIVLDIKRDERMVELSFQIFNELGISFRSNVSIYAADGSRIDGTIFQLTDTFHFQIPVENNPAQIRLNGFGYNLKNSIIDIASLTDGHYTIKRKSYNGYFSKGTIKKIWFQRRPTGIRYQLNERKRYLPKKWNCNWINKLYRDY